MKYFLILFFSLINLNCINAQEVAFGPYYPLQKKWIEKNYGIEVGHDRITILNPKNYWKLSDKKDDKYYFLGEPFENTKDTFISWVYNDVLLDAIRNYKAIKIKGKQYRLFKLVINKDDKLEFSISEKIVEFDNQPNTYWHGKIDSTFVKKFIMTRFNNEKQNK